ncbi:MAG TPA: primosomal protein N' [Candidatus Methanoperedens sp.]|nr:primosomal protein N' [Candidatus Methanoperedens sp.]
MRLALPEALQFGIPDELRGAVRPGQRVLVPLRSGRDVGYVVGLSDEPKVAGVRPIERLLDAEPQLPADLLELILSVSRHYLAPIGLVLRAAVPQSVHYEGMAKAAAGAREVLVAALAVPPEEAEALLPALAPRAPAQAEALAALCRARGRAVAAATLNRAALEALRRKGLATLSHRQVRRGIIAPAADPVEPAPLTAAQREVFARVVPALGGAARPLLLHGVTGSGKTEIYLRAIRSLPADRQALLLVPEVSLTVQLIRHLRDRLPFAIAVWHHQLSDGEKYDLWRALRRGEVRAVVGTRSAVFAPLPRLGLVVVDEEQDSSFKQEETPCYHARDAAIERAARCHAAAILGSATPSLESRRLAETGTYELLRLPERYTGLPLPAVEIVDLREHTGAAPGAPRTRRGDHRLLSPPLVEAAAAALAQGDQVLFFLNRRGFAPHTQCRTCGAGISCPNCRVSLVFHAPERIHLCHYCGFRAGAPEVCPSCGAPALRLAGSGTQRLEEEIRGAFPGREVVRLDSDTAARKGAGARLIADFESGRADILVGTQLVAKGLHFPRLTLVGVISTDLLLNLPDFRAAERAFSLVAQVAGRAGRGVRPGRVLVQTRQPGHYALEAAQRHDYEAFYATETAFRRELDYPPFFELVALRIDAPDPGRLGTADDAIASQVREALRSAIEIGQCHVLGPVPAPLEKLRNRWRSQILVKAHPLEAATDPLRAIAGRLHEETRRAGARLLIDVGPLNLM